MKLKFIMRAQNIVQTNGQIVSLYPLKEPVSPGVGTSFSGSYATSPNSIITAHDSFSQTNVGFGEVDGVYGILALGQLSLHAETPKGDKIVLFFSYEFITVKPSPDPIFGPLRGQVTSARFNGRPAKASMRVKFTQGIIESEVTIWIDCDCCT